MGKQGQARFGGLHAVGAALEDLKPELLLDVGDAARRRRGGDRHGLGRARDAAQLRRGQQQPQRGQVKAQALDVEGFAHEKEAG